MLNFNLPRTFYILGFILQLIQGNGTNVSCIKETEEAFPYFQETETNVFSCFHPNNSQVTSQIIDTTGLNSAQALEHMDAESGRFVVFMPGFMF